MQQQDADGSWQLTRGSAGVHSREAHAAVLVLRSQAIRCRRHVKNWCSSVYGMRTVMSGHRMSNWGQTPRFWRIVFMWSRMDMPLMTASPLVGEIMPARVHEYGGAVL